MVVHKGTPFQSKIDCRGKVIFHNKIYLNLPDDYSNKELLKYNKSRCLVVSTTHDKAMVEIWKNESMPIDYYEEDNYGMATYNNFHTIGIFLPFEYFKFKPK